MPSSWFCFCWKREIRSFSTKNYVILDVRRYSWLMDTVPLTERYSIMKKGSKFQTMKSVSPESLQVLSQWVENIGDHGWFVDMKISAFVCVCMLIVFFMCKSWNSDVNELMFLWSLWQSHNAVMLSGRSFSYSFFIFWVSSIRVV